MKTRLIIIGLLLILVSANIASAEKYNIIRAEQKECLDYALEYQSNNPEWGIVLISKNPGFQGWGHYENFLIDENQILYLHDSKWNQTMGVGGWQYVENYPGVDYYYFFINGEIPQRWFKGSKTSNALEVYHE